MSADAELCTGLDRVLADPPREWRAARLGLVCNQASVTSVARGLRSAHEALAEVLPGALRALFGPQHGLWSDAQDNMVETAHGFDRRLGVPVWSLYSETRRPRAEWLRELDLVLVDLPDVGCRVYTYVWTLVHVMEVAGELGVPVVVLDRPNPVGGALAEGPLLEPACASFVGGHSIPMRHGLTLGELARLVVRERGLACDLSVVRCSGWSRADSFPTFARPWLAPSPNLPRYEGALVYSGTVLFEGTNLSEGRGTTLPFETVGAPWIDPYRWRDALLERGLAGVLFRPLCFEPTFQKHAGQRCGGLALHVVDEASFRAWTTAVALIETAFDLWPEHSAWRPPPYEYETERMPIDLLAGTSALRERDEARLALGAAELAAWRARTAPIELYT